LAFETALEIVHQAHGAQAGERLVFRTGPLHTGIGPIRDLDVASASMVQALKYLPVRIVLAIVCPESFSAPARHAPSLQFLMDMSPMASDGRTPPAVP
jgi:hypothetical protein